VLRTTLIDSGWQFSASSWLESPGWYGYSKLEWLPAQVPGHVHLDLVDNGVIADPFQRQFELGSAWVDEEDFFYKTEFDYTPDPTLPRVELRFSGLDTVCSIELNAQPLATHDNMFVPLSLDVTDRLLAGKNQLLIRFESAARVGRERRARYLEQEGLPDSVLHFEERAFVRKAQYMFGWDWGPRLVSCGIWDKVELLQFAARIHDVHVAQQHAPDGSVELRFSSRFEGPGRMIHWLEGVAEPIRDGDSIRLANPELWWPAGLGSQRLYTVRSQLLGASAAGDTLSDQDVHDRREFRIGLCSTRLLQEPDEFGESFQFEVNGRKIWAAGANWIPDSSFPARITREQVRAQVQRARDMNMNMLRVWGGGLYESEDFYDACDEFGLLVWQDFPYGCCYYPDDEGTQALARAEAEVAVRRLRNRASLAFWCGNNENLTMFQEKWTDSKRHPPRYYGAPIYEEVLSRVVAELDPGRSYLPTSPWGGERANGGGVGDQHYWDVWHGRGDWTHYDESTARFASEFGFAAAPGLATWSRMLPGIEAVLEQPLRHPVARWHDKTRKGYDTFIGFVELHYPASTSLGDWLYFSQLNQRDALRHGIEHFRRSRFCKGSLIWQLNDCWPVQSWAVLDAAAEYKAAAYELRRLYGATLLSLERQGDTFRLWLIRDNAPGAVRGTVELAVHSLSDGRRLANEQQTLEIENGERKLALELDVSRFPAANTLVMASFLGQTTFRLLSEPKAAQLVAPSLRARVEASQLIVESDVPLVDFYVWDEQGNAHFTDNFVTLASPGQIKLPFRGSLKALRARSLQGHHTL